MIALGAIAVVAAGLAVWAMVKAYEAKDQTAASDRVLRLERTLDARSAELRNAIDRAGEEADITRIQRELRRKATVDQLGRLDRRLETLAADVSTANSSSEDIQADVTALSERVEELANRPRR